MTLIANLQSPISVCRIADCRFWNYHGNYSAKFWQRFYGR